MRPFLVFRLFLRASRVRRKRAMLTMAAIAWGTLSLLLLLAFGEGLRDRLVTANDAMGKDLAIVWPGTTTRPFAGLPTGRFVPLRVEDRGTTSPGRAGASSMPWTCASGAG